MALNLDNLIINSESYINIECNINSTASEQVILFLKFNLWMGVIKFLHEKKLIMILEC